MVKIKYLPNCITTLRIIGALSLFFIAPFTTAFFVVYTLTGITDLLDGFIARKTNTTSEFGSKLDSVADILFYVIMVLRILPKLLEKVVAPIWIAAFSIAGIRVISYIIAFVKYHCFSSLHTYASKVSGLSVFFTPYVAMTNFLNAFCIVLCVIAFVAAVEELITHIVRDKYRYNVKSIFNKVED